MSMIRSSRERNRTCSPVSRRSRGRIWFLAKSFPDERITNQVCKESPFASPFSGKFDYVYIPFPDSKSMTWEFFTEDELAHARRLPRGTNQVRGRPPLRSSMSKETPKSDPRQQTDWKNNIPLAAVKL